MANFGYFWDWNWLYDNAANFRWLEICWKHVSCMWNYHETQNYLDPYGHFSHFENLLVRYPHQNISKLAFFNHIWTHLPGVNGNPLVVFMTCTNICQGLWRTLKKNCKIHRAELSMVYIHRSRFWQFWRVQKLRFSGAGCPFSAGVFTQIASNCKIGDFAVAGFEPGSAAGAGSNSCCHVQMH